mmetsp:Transcript_412/g.643  ORF Transcript_412/g.643 Transcript_412/m.643 type:complete len:126 (+) Transcript_412:905-1282(+)
MPGAALVTIPVGPRAHAIIALAKMGVGNGALLVGPRPGVDIARLAPYTRAGFNVGGAPEVDAGSIVASSQQSGLDGILPTAASTVGVDRGALNLAAREKVSRIVAAELGEGATGLVRPGTVSALN